MGITLPVNLAPALSPTGWYIVFCQPKKIIKYYQKMIGFLDHCMSRRINSRGCGSRHTGAGGSRCKILLARKSIKPDSTMATSDSSIPEQDSPDYIPYLEGRIAEHDELLDQAQEQSKVRSLEQKLSDLTLCTNELTREEVTPSTGFTSRVLLPLQRPGVIYMPQTP